MYLYALLMCTLVILLPINAQSNVQSNQRTIFEFLSTYSKTTKFVSKLNDISKNLFDNSAISLLSSNQLTGGSGGNADAGLTVFIPIDDSFNSLDANYLNELRNIRNDMYNLIVREKYNLDKLRSLSGSNLTSTFGNNPRLFVKVVRNFFNRQLNPSSFPLVNSTNLNVNNTNIYNQFSYLYQQQQQQQVYQGPPISPLLPLDELYLINNAIILEQFECSNGFVYIINAYPRYYDKSLWNLITTENGLRQTLDQWRSRTIALQADVIRNALNSYASNTYFLPSDIAFQQFNNQSLLNNASFLYDVLLKSHIITGRVLFDYYFDKQSPTSSQTSTNGQLGNQEIYKTDTGLQVFTEHRINNQSTTSVNGQAEEEIIISIGHVKGRILPNMRNIYCASGILHVVDTVLGIPTINAYQLIQNKIELNSFKRLIDKSSKYSMLLQSIPSSFLVPTAAPFDNRNNFGLSRQSMFDSSAQFQYLTILAPNEAALFSINDYLNNNQTALDQFLAQHIIINGNSMSTIMGYFTDHDTNIFQNTQSYQTMLPGSNLIAQVTLDDNGISNRVILSLQTNPTLSTRIINGNNRVSNGVVHIVDRVLVPFIQQDINFLLDKLAQSQSTLGASYSQFLSLLQSTGILNDLKQTPTRQYTLFIPTNDALSRFQSLLNTNDQNIKKQIVNRHLCYSTLRTSSLSPNQNGMNFQQQQQQTTDNQLICENLLREDLVLSRNTTNFRVQLNGVASANTLFEINGEYSSLFMIDRPIINALDPRYGLDNYVNSISTLNSNFLLIFISFIYLIYVC